MEILISRPRQIAQLRLRKWGAFLATGIRMRVLIACVMALMPYGAAAIAAESLEYGVKAAFLYKFSAYVDWPQTAFESPASPFTICLADSSEQFNDTLKKVIHGQRVNNRTTVIRQIKAAAEVAGCHILYVGTTNPDRMAEIVEVARGNNVLTVSDSSSQGIIIDFLIIDNHVRFNIDDEAAAQNALVISSRLLSLAVNVKRRNSGDQ